MAQLEQIGHFKGAGTPKTYGEDNKTVTKFYLDIDKDGDYPTFGEFTVFGDRIDLSKFQIGEKVAVKFNISARKWTNKETEKTSVFQSLVAWSMVKLEEEEIYQQPEETKQSEQLPDETSDGLPF